MDTKEKLKKVIYYLQDIKSEKCNKKSGKAEDKIICKNWEQEFNNIIDKIDSNGYIPNSVMALVDENIHYEESKSKEKDNELLFPLPYNKAQKEIVQKIENNFGVVVEGGPGTGKTQTIVNLICHFLANNKRVLVTGQNDRTLEMLFEKIPDNIKPLCVDMIGNTGDDIRRLEFPIRKITEKLSLDLEKMNKDNEFLENNLHKCNARQKQLYDNLKTAEKIENGAIKYRGKYFKLLGIAKWLKQNENQYSWIEDKIRPKEKCPMTDAKFSRLIYLVSNCDKLDIIRFSRIESLLYNIPSSQEAILVMERFNCLRENYEKYTDVLKDWCVPCNVDYDYNKIISALDNTQKFLENIQGTWMENVFESARQSDTVKVVLEQMILRCNFYIKKICNIIKEISSYSVDIPTDMDIVVLVHKFQFIYKQYEQKGRISKLFRVLHPDCQEILQNCKIDDSLISSKEQAQIVMKYIEQKYVEDCLKKLWNSSIKVYKGIEIKNINLSVLSEIEDVISKLDTLINWEKVIKNSISMAMRNIAFLKEMDCYKKETYEHLKEGILSIKYLNEYEHLKNYISKLKASVVEIGDFDRIVQAIEEYDIRMLRNSYDKLDKLKEKAPKLSEAVDLLSQIQEYPKLISTLLNEEDKLNMLTKYKNFSIAWKWRQFDYILNKAHQFEINEIEERVESEREIESKLINEILENKTWYNELKNIGETEKRSLYAWLDVVKKIGKGTGIHSDMYKNLAAKELEIFRNIIPIWVMSQDNVIEKLPLSEEMFDLVIIDESNQCDIFAISALFRAKKAIVIGDDNQITTEAIGVNTNKIQNLIQKYLRDIPHCQWFDMKTSLYSTALRTFKERVILKENFRCVPEIIGFSNEICYSNEIIPLRQSNNMEKWGYPIENIRVNGKRDSIKPINNKEAEVIVNKIDEYCKKSMYKGMTIGVISLLGDAQAEMIEELLEKKIGIEEMKERKIVCGNAYSLQGDERDIVFLSMVIGNNVKFNALTKESDIRRFNVAVSRARNKLILVHSVDLKDINPQCIRAKLLNYCIKLNHGKKKMDLKNMFQSQFQKDVYRIMKDKGYDIKPQVMVGKYKIDFVVDANNTKIAIECNGDNDKEVYDWEQEYYKQMALQRMGWKILKINGSEFYRNPENTINKLYKKIESLYTDKGIA